MIKASLQISALIGAFAGLTAAIWAATAPVIDWKIAGPFGGTATTLAIDPKTPSVVLAGGMSSLLFQSHDSGADWDLLNFPKRNLSEVTSILIDPGDSDHYLVGMIAAEGGGLFESHDAGKTWRPVKDLHDTGVRALAASASQPSRFIAGTLRGVMLSDDSGKTWARISDPQNLEMLGITAVAIDTKDPNVIYAGTPHLPWKTTDGGKTWESIHTGMIDDSDVFSIFVDPSDPSDVLASACSGIYSSSDRGDMWHKLMGIPNTSRRTHVVREDPLSASTIYAGTTTGLFKSSNRGTTWKTLNNTQVNALAFDPAHPQDMYLALEYEGIGKSLNGGDQINMINNGFVDRVISWVTTSGNRLIAVETQEGETSGIFVSADEGDTWSPLRVIRGLAGVHLNTIAGFSSEDRILLAASAHQIYKSIDGGANWKPVTMRLVTPPPPEPEKPKTVSRTTRTRQTARTRARVVKPRPIIKDISPSEINGLYSLKNGTKEVLFAATDMGLLESADMGERWTQSSIPGTPTVWSLYAAPNANGYLIARVSGGLYMSKDYGEHWTNLAFPLPASDVNDIAIPPDDSAPLLVATRVGLYSSPDGGDKWFANPGKLPASTFASVIYASQDETAYAVEYGRLYRCPKGSNSWSEVPSTLPTLRIRQLWIPTADSKRLYGITSDLGIIFRN